MPVCAFRSTDVAVLKDVVIIFSPAKNIVGTRNFIIIIKSPSPIAPKIFIMSCGFIITIKPKFINRHYDIPKAVMNIPLLPLYHNPR